jgi:hypothetical protein
MWSRKSEGKKLILPLCGEAYVHENRSHTPVVSKRERAERYLHVNVEEQTIISVHTNPKPISIVCFAIKAIKQKASGATHELLCISVLISFFVDVNKRACMHGELSISHRNTYMLLPPFVCIPILLLFTAALSLLTTNWS